MNTATWRRGLLLGCFVLALTLAMAARGQSTKEPGLLFYLSGDHAVTADVSAGGTPEPNYEAGVSVINDGAKGQGLRCAHTQLLSYWAPGNVYAQRGTVSFFWRSREPVGPTPFPIFRVGYADHSSWDMVFLRIDYNGKPGFDAFVTDASLARTRVSYAMPAFPKPDQWTHFALAWDETRGIRFYVDGRLAARQDGVAIFDAALDQFGPHSRVIGPMQVQSAYNFVRGGDIDELRIYDRMLSDDNVSSLGRGEAPTAIPALERDVQSPEWQREWWYRYGWNRTGEFPAPLTTRHASIRKVEIHDVYDIRRWWWKATDGIRETTWPGVFNRSRLAGRNDYFQLPDWDCYSLSGKSIRFVMPAEPWNQIEVSGAAFGRFSVTADSAETPVAPRDLFDRPKGQERTSTRLPQPVHGQTLRFTNVEQETPIGELGAYYVADVAEPAGTAKLTYRVQASAGPDQPCLKPLLDYISGRFPADEQRTVVALPAGAPRTLRAPGPRGLPIVHVLVPADFRDVTLSQAPRGFSYTWTSIQAGLDGVAIDLPALNVKPTHGQYVPIHVQVHDPIWPLRTMMDVSVSVKPGEPHTLWLDTRDRILPNGKSLWITIAASSAEFGPEALDGAEIRLVFKKWQAAAREHVLDRFTQVRDNYAQIVEEHPNSRRLSLYTQFETDLTDLLRVEPDHELGRQYWADYNREQPRPSVTLAEPPAGAPLWAFRQVEALGALRRFVNWYIDNRQIDNGEFGGGLSDDGDLTNWWPGTALMGSRPEKVKESLLREMEAFYAQGMFTNGLATIQADELHSYEEGISVLGQALMLDYGSPRQLERAMETARAVEKLTGVNAAGHRHVRSCYFSGTKVAEDSVWGYSKAYSYLVTHPALLLASFNGSPRVRQWVTELADGLLAHRTVDAAGHASFPATIHFVTDKDLPEPSDRAWPMLWAVYRWTGDRKYLQPMLESGPRNLAAISGNALDLAGLRQEWGPKLLALVEGPADRGGNALHHQAWQVSGDRQHLAELYTRVAEAAALREYINTEGSLWIDRVNVDHADLQRSRLGGVALVRNMFYPGHAVSWDFSPVDAAERVAILVRDPTPTRLRIVAYNLDSAPVEARMTGWDVEPGIWSMTQGTGAESGEAIAGEQTTRTVAFERSSGLDIVFPPKVVTIIELNLVTKGVPYWSRPDLGISDADVRVEGHTMKVTVHSLGAVDTPASTLVLRGRDGRVIASASVPVLRAPVDLVPKTAVVSLSLPAGSAWKGGSLTIEAPRKTPETTLRNNVVRFRE
ncbi:MAG TPA: LamG-like jellyroll fold domain-containing protein [Vicinamibacterales bacterium]|jgi:hypothetical protein